MTRVLCLLLSACPVVLTACPGPGPEDAGPDAGAPHAAAADAGDGADAGGDDAGDGVDAGPPDAQEIPEQDLGWESFDPPDGIMDAQWAHISADLGDGRAFVFGGIDVGAFGGGSVLGHTYLFDANQDPPGFTEVTPAIGSSPEPRYCGCAAYHPEYNKVLLYGGRDLGALMGSTTWVFDLDDNSWTISTPFGSGPGLGCSMAYYPGDGKVYKFGGASAGGSSNRLWTYDFSDDTWTEIEDVDPPSARYDAELFALSDRLIVAGGAASAQNDFRSDVWSFNPANNKWVELSPNAQEPTGRRVPWVRVAPDQSHFYFGFGNNFGEPLDDLWTFDLADNTFTAVDLDPAPLARSFSRALPGGWGEIGTLMYGYDMLDIVPDLWTLNASSEALTWW